MEHYCLYINLIKCSQTVHAIFKVHEYNLRSARKLFKVCGLFKDIRYVYSVTNNKHQFIFLSSLIKQLDFWTVSTQNIVKANIQVL